MTTERDRIQARTADEARFVLRTRIDLDAFLALDSDARGARWRQWDAATKADAVIQQLLRAGLDWDIALVASWIARYDAKWEIASDQAVPPAAEIAMLAKERSETAQRHEDWAGAAQLTRVRVNLLNGARLHWSLGDLLIQSVNNPGAVYSVSRRGCTCPNGLAGKAACWHVALFDLLIDMQEERAATADMAAERAEMGRRLCAARSKLLEVA